MPHGDPSTPEPFGVAQAIAAPPLEPLPFAAPTLLPPPRVPGALPPLAGEFQPVGSLPAQTLAPPVPIEEPEPLELGEFPPVIVERPQVIAATQPTVLPAPSAPQEFLPAPGIQAAQPVAIERETVVAPPPPIAPAPDPLAVNEELGATLTNVSELGEQRTILRRRATDLQTQIALEQDPAKRDALIAQQQETVSALQLTDAELAANQEQAAVVGAEADARQQAEASRARLDAQQQVIETQRQQRAEAVVDEDERQRARDEEQAEITRTKERRIEVIRKGAPELIGRTIGEMVAEALAATDQRRPANFGAVFARLRTDAQDVLQRETEAVTEEVRLGVDRAADLARQQDRRRLLDAAADEAVLEDILQDVDVRIARAGNERDRQALLGVRVAAQDQLDAAKAKSAVVAETAALRAAKERAQIAKLNAEAREKRARAAKEERRGRGRGRGRDKETGLLRFRSEIREIARTGPEGKKLAELIEKQGVSNPFDDGRLLRRPDNTPFIARDVAEAKELASSVAAIQELNSLIETAISQRAADGFEFTRKGIATAEGKRMASTGAQITLGMKNALLGESLDQQTGLILDDLAGGDLTGVDDPTPALRQLQATMVRGFGNKLKSAGFRGKVTVPITRDKPEAKLEDVETSLNADFDRRTGTHGLTTAEFAAKLDEKDVVRERDIGRAAGPTPVGREEFQGPGPRVSRPREAPAQRGNETDEAFARRQARFEEEEAARQAAARTQPGVGVGEFSPTRGVEGVRVKRLRSEIGAEDNARLLDRLLDRDQEIGEGIEQANEDGDRDRERRLVKARKENAERMDLVRKKLKQQRSDVEEFDERRERESVEAAKARSRRGRRGRGREFQKRATEILGD